MTRVFRTQIRMFVCLMVFVTLGNFLLYGSLLLVKDCKIQPIVNTSVQWLCVSVLRISWYKSSVIKAISLDSRRYDMLSSAWRKLSILILLTNGIEHQSLAYKKKHSNWTNTQLKYICFRSLFSLKTGEHIVSMQFMSTKTPELPYHNENEVNLTTKFFCFSFNHTIKSGFFYLKEETIMVRADAFVSFPLIQL